MLRRLSFVPLALLLSVCLVVLPACKKKKPEEDGGGGGGGGSIPASVSSDYLLFLQFKAKDLRDSALLTEVTQAFTKAGGTDEWNKVETEMSKPFGVKPTDIDTVTFAVADINPERGPSIILIVEANKPINKDEAYGVRPGTKADSRGFYTNVDRKLVHYPNNKTAVMVSESLADQYLNGYAKNTAGGWPLTSDLTTAAGGHTLFAVVNGQKIPRDELDDNTARDFAGMLSARKVTVTADLKGKAVSLGARATFADAASATKAKDEALAVLGKASAVVDEFAGNKEMAGFASLKPAVAEAQRAVKNVRIDAVGTDLTLSASYKADFDVGQVVTDAVKMIRVSAQRMRASNNLRQIGLALHNYGSTYQDRIPVHGIGMNGSLLRTPTDKPLLSWRVALLPFIEEDALYNKFKLNEPWDSPHNKALLKEMPRVFAPVGKPAPAGKEGLTHLQMVIGKGGLRTGESLVSISAADGTSNTVAVIETTEWVEWTKPADVVLPAKFAPGELKKKFGGQFDNVILVVFCDGSVRALRNTVSERTLQLLFDPADGQLTPTDW